MRISNVITDVSALLTINNPGDRYIYHFPFSSPSMGEEPEVRVIMKPVKTPHLLVPLPQGERKWNWCVIPLHTRRHPRVPAGRGKWEVQIIKP